MDNQEQQLTTPTNKAYLIVLLIAIVFLSGGVAYLTLFRGTPTPVRKQTIPAVTPLPREITVKLTKDGFVPNVVTIEMGAAVRWINESGEANATVNSNPYPVNNEHKEMNLGAFNGSTLMHIFTKAGSYGYHNYFHPEWTGTVIVK